MTSIRHYIRPLVIAALLLAASHSRADAPVLSLSMEWGAQGPHTSLDLGVAQWTEDRTLDYRRQLNLYDSRARAAAQGAAAGDGHDSRSFCDRTLVGCIAIATLIGAGIFLFVEEFEDE